MFFFVFRLQVEPICLCQFVSEMNQTTSIRCNQSEGFYTSSEMFFANTDKFLKDFGNVNAIRFLKKTQIVLLEFNSQINKKFFSKAARVKFYWQKFKL